MIIEVDDPNDFLEHFGIKGMRWGVLKKRETSKQSAGHSNDVVKTKNVLEQSVVDKFKLTTNDFKILNSKFGSDYPGESEKKTSTNEQTGKNFSLTDKQKKLALIGLGVVAAGLATYGAKKYLDGRGANATDLNMANLLGWRGDFPTPHTGLSPEQFAALSTKSLTLPKGTPFRRAIQYSEEAWANPQGFFASHRPEDDAAYRAILPIDWGERRGGEINRGAVVTLIPKVDIKAPSHKETYELYRGYLGLDESEASNDKLRRNVPNMIQNWGYNGNDSKSFFDFVRGQGYNALQDFNDMGRVANSPMRLLNGNEFSVSDVEKLSVRKIREAQRTVQVPSVFDNLYSGGTLVT